MRVGYGYKTSAIPVDVEIEGRIGAQRCSDSGARFDKHAHSIAEQRINPLAYRDVLGANTMMAGQRLLEVVVLGIAIFPDAGCSSFDRLDHTRRRAEAAFIGAEPCPEGDAALALQCFGPDKGHRRRQRLHHRSQR